MGLAGPKIKTKISHDPNNTRWTRDSASFGHKIMSSQGWNPGELLGAKDAPHAEFHTAANASYIRVALREDNLGLGAKIGSGVGHGECTGLDVFKNLLGRLNGADEADLAKEQQSRDDLKRAIYTERKWGSIRFVPGGVLVGDKIQDLIDGEKERLRKLADDSENSSSDSSSESETEEEISEPVEQAPKKSKKRKAESLEDSAPEASAAKVKKSKKTQDADVDSEDDKKLKKKSKKRRDKEADADEPSDEAKAKKSKKEKKEKKKEKKEKRSKKEKSNEDSVDESSSKEAKKAAKREKREKRKALEEAGSSTEITVVLSTPVSSASTGRSTPVMMQGRHAVRSRNIAAKRLAAMDTASLNQIFMIKS
ncbi:hypothetical protein BP5796_10689 [Coleophoma crateriformis]|uniref:G-patch domain-containing protein n=1 Tax=Coleophoma crateriformis TaxID=565419 RepID=A0A3D8QQY5_9HELO|nr:hypothetical protein BP5796_10689 [Coleophoma crateriformis]